MNLGLHKKETSEVADEFGKTEGDLAYVLGNKHNPVIVLGDDPLNTDVDIRGDDGAVTQKTQDNVLVAHFYRVESVPRTSVYDEEAPNA